MSERDNGRFDMSEVLKYKGHIGSVKYCDKESMYRGTMQNVRALVLYDAKDLDGLQLAFEEAVDHYIGICKSEGWDPKVGMPEPALKAEHTEARRSGQSAHRPLSRLKTGPRFSLQEAGPPSWTAPARQP